MEDGDPFPLGRYGIGDSMDGLVQFVFLGLGCLFFAIDLADDLKVALDVVIGLGLEDQDRDVALFQLGRQFFVVVSAGND